MWKRNSLVVVARNDELWRISRNSTSQNNATNFRDGGRGGAGEMQRVGMVVEIGLYFLMSTEPEDVKFLDRRRMSPFPRGPGMSLTKMKHKCLYETLRL